MIAVDCPICSTTLRAPDTARGRRVRCSKCNHRFRLGDPNDAAVTQDDAPSGDGAAWWEAPPLPPPPPAILPPPPSPPQSLPPEAAPPSSPGEPIEPVPPPDATIKLKFRETKTPWYYKALRVAAIVWIIASFIPVVVSMVMMLFSLAALVGTSGEKKPEEKPDVKKVEKPDNPADRFQFGRPPNFDDMREDMRKQDEAMATTMRRAALTAAFMSSGFATVVCLGIWLFSSVWAFAALVLCDIGQIIRDRSIAQMRLCFDEAN